MNKNSPTYKAAWNASHRQHFNMYEKFIIEWPIMKKKEKFSSRFFYSIFLHNIFYLLELLFCVAEFYSFCYFIHESLLLYFIFLLFFHRISKKKSCMLSLQIVFNSTCLFNCIVYFHSFSVPLSCSFLLSNRRFLEFISLVARDRVAFL